MGWSGRWLRRRVLKQAARVVACSDFTGRCAVRVGAMPGRVVTCLPVVDEALLALAREDPAPEPRTPTVLSVGRLVERKGFDTVIRALPAVRKQVPDVRYVVVGDGPDRERLEGLARGCGVEDAVVFATAPDADALANHYRACHVFAMPSRYLEARGDVEGFGIVFLEAAAFGRPSLGGRAGGVPEAVLDEQTGLLCDPESASDAASQLVRLLTDDALRERLGKAARERVLADFTPARYARAFAEIVDAL
jgi:phosphatidylinositol alpha-1,6-mannosyltransferase